jgi:hypothetical protein
VTSDLASGAVLDLIVPVLGRPHRAWPFVHSLATSGAGGVRVTVVANLADEATAMAWVEARKSGWLRPDQSMTVLVTILEPGSFAQKCNEAFEVIGRGPGLAGPAPWVMLCGDDVHFHGGWLQAAQRHMANPDVSVIGTNTAGPIPDGGTPHPIIRRSYIDEVGAGWDGPGVLCHEYRHNFVDVEIALAAQDRGVYVHALDVVVEHLAHYHGKAPMDPTYQISADTVDADRRVFTARAARHRPVVHRARRHPRRVR